MMKSGIVLLILLFALSVVLPGQAHAENPVEEVFMDGFYGGLAGALVGAAFIAFSKDPENHLENLYIGAGVGVLAGTTYGILKASRALAELHDGTVTVQVPTLRMEIEPSSKVSGPARSLGALWSVDLFGFSF